MNNQPLVSGFTFIKNGLTLGYPIRESVESIESLCDEIIINVGFDNEELSGDDGTYAYLRDHFNHKKFTFLKSYWNPEMTSKGLILSEQTNIALNKCKGKICQYIQGDEVLHEDDLPAIHDGLIEMERNPRYEGLVFDYIHFYGNVDAYLYTRRIYRREVRAIRNGLGIKSHLDAQGFRHADNSKLKCKKINARVFHYGWARKEKIMAQKIQAMDKLYHGKDFENQKKFEYQRIWGLKKFLKTHPELMYEWIEKNRNDIDIHDLKKVYSKSDISLAVSDFLEFLTGQRFGEYRNYKLIR
jgi:hypothetical protein